jgi:putative acetyltransferase
MVTHVLTRVGARDAPREVTVRAEEPSDARAIRRVVVAAFKGQLEADLVDTLRRHNKVSASLVATLGHAIVGHVLLSDVALHGPGLSPRGVGLAPLAVRPALQRRGIGATLMRAAIAGAREAGYGFVVLLGDPAYYRRFGFRTAATLGLACEFEAPEEAFMALELASGALAGAGGLVRYEPEFDAAL